MTEELNETKESLIDQTSNEYTIFSAIFKDDETVATKKQELLLTFMNPDVFENEYYAFFIMTKDRPRIKPNKSYIQLYLATNRAVFQRSNNIILSNYSMGETDPYVEFVNSCLTLYDELEKNEVSDDDFYRTVEMHKMEYINMNSINVLEESTVILTEGVQKGNKNYSGYTDMRSNLKTRFQSLDNMMEKKERKGTIIYGVTDVNEEDQSGKLKLVSTYGIAELDSHAGGIYEGDMVSVLAPAKGGKTRITTHILHNAIIEGTNVLMWSIENGHKGWEALLRARHFNWYYNRNTTDVTQKRIITSDMIRKGDLTPELEQLEEASWLDLRYNPDYGRIGNLDEDFDFDTAIEVIENAVNDVGAKLISIDYLQLISGGGKNISKNERIGEMYKKMLQFLKKKKVAGVFPAQLKQTVVGNIDKTDTEDFINMELRDAAGESYEVIKTPDVNLMLYGSVEDIRNGSMKLLSIPSRNISPFEPIELYCDLGTCSFTSVSKD